MSNQAYCYATARSSLTARRSDHRHADLQGCIKLTQLPKRLNVWFLNLRGCTGLKSLPDDAQVQIGSLSIAGCSQLSELPKSLKQLSTLDVSDCPNIVKTAT